jgi:hypothetical protein
MVVRTKNPLSQYLRKQNMNLKKPLATGGRVGLKRGGGLMTRKSNIQKIKETFGPRQSRAKNLKTVDKNKNPGLAKLPIEVRNKMGYAAKGGRAMLKKGSKFPDLNKDGKITKADILMGRGVMYPSAYANMYASAVCSGKVTPGGKKKRKKAMGGGAMVDMTRMKYLKGGQV